MKKLIVIMLLIFSWMNMLHSQQKTFSKAIFDGVCDPYNTKINSMVTSFDGGYVIVGVLFPFYQSLGIILKVDSDGNVLWNKEVSGPFSDSWLNGIGRSKDSCFIVTGFTCVDNCRSKASLCIKIDGNGDIVWSKTYKFNQISEFTSIQPTQDSGYVLIGSINNSEKILVSKINSNGDIEWTNILQAGNNRNFVFAIKEDVHGSFFITGNTDYHSPYSNHAFIIKLSSSGTIVWAKEFMTDIINDIEFTSNGILLHSYNSNKTILFESDTMGNILWSKMYNLGKDYYNFGSKPKIHKTQDNSFVFINQGDNDLSHIVKIDTVGDIIWSKYLEIDPIDVIETSSKEYFIPGNRLDIGLASIGTQIDCYSVIGLMQIDSLGNGQICVRSLYNDIQTSVATITTDTIVFSSSSGGVADTISLKLNSESSYNSVDGCAIRVSPGSNETNHENRINVYPNPSVGIFNLKLDASAYGQLIILNCIGQKIYESAINSQSSEIDLYNQPNGIYFFKIFFTHGESVFGKLVINK